MRKRTLDTTAKRKLLRRIARLARTAAVLRLRGDITRAVAYERQVDALVSRAEAHRLAGAATLAEERGHKAAHRLYKKSRPHARKAWTGKLLSSRHRSAACSGAGANVRGLHETVRGQVQCPACRRLFFPVRARGGMVLPRHGAVRR